MNWKDPDYDAIITRRIENLQRLRQEIARDPSVLDDLKAYYRENPADFIDDWGVTYDPRNAEIGRPTYVPFILFPKQREWIDWVMARWRNREPGLCEKSRDMGVSWAAMALSCTLCLFREGLAIGVGSRKTEYVDKIGTFKPLLPKARIFMENLPVEFKGDWVAWRDAPFMRVTFPTTGSIIAGEGGDDIGRGDRTSLYLVDEFAHFERPDLVEAALSQTTNCRIDMSSVRGMNNAFAQKRWSGRVDVFIFDYKSDPRKDQAWYDKQCAELDPVVVAQEIDRDYQASVSGIVIPAAWVRACVDAKRVLGIAPSGTKGASMDVADEGADKNAIALTTGTTVDSTEEWTGQGSDIYQSTEHGFEKAEAHGSDFLEYDADGLGAGVRGDARVINEGRVAAGGKAIRAVGFRGSEAVHDPDGIVEGTIGREGDRGRTNKDYFLNRKAQAWWEIRRRARNTFRWIVGFPDPRTGVNVKVPCAPDEILDISSACPHHMKLVAELSQATYKQTMVGKIQINKAPEGMKSPNRADAVVIRFAPKEAPPMRISRDFLAQIARAGGSGRRVRPRY